MAQEEQPPGVGEAAALGVGKAAGGQRGVSCQGDGDVWAPGGRCNTRRRWCGGATDVALGGD